MNNTSHLTNGNVNVYYFADTDGFQLSAINADSGEKRVFRFDAASNKPGSYIKYDLMKKPTTRTHEIVEVGDSFHDWVELNMDSIASKVK